MHRILAQFKERDTRDELGLGSLRDAIADLLFPGTSTIQTRLRLRAGPCDWYGGPWETRLSLVADPIGTPGPAQRRPGPPRHATQANAQVPMNLQEDGAGARKAHFSAGRTLAMWRLPCGQDLR